jgi:gluconolactonase
MLDIDMAKPGLERLIDRSAPLDEIVPGLVFGEGPAWNKRTKELFFVDIIDDKVWKWKPGVGKQIVVHPAGKPDGLTFDHQGRLLCAGWGARTVWRLDLADGSITTIASHYEGKKLNTPNDIIVKSDGSIYWTDMGGGLYNVGMSHQDIQRYLDFYGVLRLRPDSDRVELVVAGFTAPNGLCFSPDEKLLYVNDSREGTIRVYDVHADGSVSNERVFIKLPGTDPGVPDGMKCDSEGNVWCTGPGGLHVTAPSGEHLGRIRLSQPATNLGWGDDDWRTLFIVCFGRVYRTRVNIPGTPVP